jgi:tetratricopeptide (TPR) repeat protein
VYFSNRSAAYLALGRLEDALADARETVRLNSEFAKGYVRMAQALEKLERVGEATEAWRKACQYDEDNASYAERLVVAEAAEAKFLAEGKFKFHSSKRKNGTCDNSRVDDDYSINTDKGEKCLEKKKKKKVITTTLSFDDDA